jgi:Protein of unknown function (DUF3604)
MAGAIVGPEHAYRFARGEAVKSNSGLLVKLPADVPASIQDRAYTSPIWYTP